MSKQWWISMLAALVGAAVLFVHPTAAQVVAMHVICSNGIQGAMERILPEYERASKQQITIEYDTSAVLKRTIEGGKAFDLTILTPAVIDDLIKEGKIAAATKTDIAKADLAVGIRAGARKSDISTADALRQRLLAAKSITYSKEGASTATFDAMLNRMGIADAVKPKTTLQTVSGRPSTSVADGDNEIVLAPASEIIPVKGVQFLGLIPAEFQKPIVMTAAVGAQAHNPDAAAALVQYLGSPAAASMIKASGMESLVRK